MEILRNSRKAIGLLKFYRSKCKLLQNGLKQPSKNTYREYKKRPFETVDTNVARDVFIYKFDKTLKFQFLTVFGFASGILFGGAAIFVLKYVSDPPSENPSEDPWWKNNPLWRNKYRNALLTICIVCGCIVSGGSYFFSLRNIRSILLLKGGQKATISTYGPFAMENKITVPLSNMSCDKERNDENKQLMLKVKGMRGFFAIDSNGSFPHPLLFDHTVGMQRAFKK